MAQTSDTGTEAEQAPARRRGRRGRELAGLAIGILAGVGITLAWLIPARHHPAAPVAPSTHAPVLVPSTQPLGPVPAGQPDPAALDGEWIAYSDHSTCADWAGGDGVSAIRLNDTQLAWFFSDTFIGPAGPAIGFSHLSGFVHNAVVVQTTTRAGNGSTFVTMTGGGACTGPGGPGNAAPVVGPPSAVPGGASDRYWDEDGTEIGGTVVKFYNHYLLHASRFPFVPVAARVVASLPGQPAGQHGLVHGPQYTARSPSRTWSRCRRTPRRPAASRSCGAPPCCKPGTRCTSTAPRARTSRSRASGSTWPASRPPS